MLPLSNLGVSDCYLTAARVGVVGVSTTAREPSTIHQQHCMSHSLDLADRPWTAIYTLSGIMDEET
jgi:hypothetical protein